MQRLLMISRCPPYPLHLGDRLIVWHLARELAAQGYTIDLLALAQKPDDHKTITAYADLFREVLLFDERSRSLWQYARRVMRDFFPQDAGHAWQPDLWRAVQTHLDQHEYDAVQVFGGVQVYEVAPLLNTVPAIITPYESYSLYLQREIEQGGSLMARLNLRMARFYERRMFTPYHRTVVLADADRDALLALNPDLPVEVIPNGIDLTYFDGGAKQRDPATLLFVGNYEYAPNQDAARLLAREILPAVRAQIPDVHLQLVGNAPPPEIQALASDHIEVTGRVPDVRPYLRKATAFVCPLRIGAGIKNKVLEALAMEIPVIGSPVSMDGIAAVDGHHALIRPIEQMVDAVIGLLRDESQQQHLRKHSRQLIIERYSWQQVARQYDTLYRRLR